MTRTVAVVGAGASGLGCAVTLAQARPVVLVERIPVTGGTSGWHHREIRNYTERARDVGVEFQLGRTAIRWSDHELHVTGPGERAVVPADHLFFAGGLRPATAANLGLAGDRVAGILPASVAEHLLEAGVRLWSNVAVLGDGPWARKIADRARKLGSRIIGIGDHVLWADERHPRCVGWSVTGRDRVSAISLRYDHGGPGTRLPIITVPCDGIVLAETPMPNRNVDGAVLPTAVDVTFVQPIAPTECHARFANGARIAETWLRTTREVDAV